jgi:hypothetical protein
MPNLPFFTNHHTMGSEDESDPIHLLLSHFAAARDRTIEGILAILAEDDGR